MRASAVIMSPEGMGRGIKRVITWLRDFVRTASTARVSPDGLIERPDPDESMLAWRFAYEWLTGRRRTRKPRGLSTRRRDDTDAKTDERDERKNN
jgi:hypothetical protein